MSYYYNYYVGYQLNGKIYPWGPYDARNRLHEVISKSSSFASDLHYRFRNVKEEEISDELRKEFEYTNWKNEKTVDVNVLSLGDLPKGNFIKTGYFLIDEVKAYESSYANYFDGFSDVLSPEVYAAKLQNELLLGKNQPKKDAEGNEYEEYNASDYMYYAYVDYKSEAYESYMIQEAIEMLRTYNLPTGAEFVVLETEG